MSDHLTEEIERIQSAQDDLGRSLAELAKRRSDQLGRLGVEGMVRSLVARARADRETLYGIAQDIRARHASYYQR